MDTRYRALRTIATIFKVLGWVILILGILGACGASASMLLGGAAYLGMEGSGGGDVVVGLILGVVVFIVMIVTVGIYALILIAASEGISVFLDIEQNTREMARRLAQRETSVPPPPGQ
jgi:hypothetical protein